MDKEFLRLIADLYRPLDRLGPGSKATSRQALALCGLPETDKLAVADIGCGTGSSALFLASELDAQVTAIDFLEPFIQALEKRAATAGLADRIEGITGDMTALPVQPESLDLIWSEGAIYNIGFATGIDYWQQFLKPGGVIAVSELTWRSATRPKAINDYWQTAYPEVDVMSAKLAVLEQAGLSPLGAFFLPHDCWMEEYFRPLKDRLPAFLADHPDNETAQAIADEQLAEIKLYEQYGRYFGYGFYIAQKMV